MAIQPFHLAFPVHDLAAARGFYGELLGCPEGRSADDWVDFDLYGHQIVAHLAPEEARPAATNASSVVSSPSLTYRSDETTAVMPTASFKLDSDSYMDQ